MVRVRQLSEGSGEGFESRISGCLQCFPVTIVVNDVIGLFGLRLLVTYHCRDRGAI